MSYLVSLTDLQIVDPSGKKNVAVDLTRALNQMNSNSGIQIKVEVTDETQRTYDTMVTVRVENQPVKVEFDRVRTDLVYRTRMPIQVVVRQEDCCALVVGISALVVGITCSGISALVVGISALVVGISALVVGISTVVVQVSALVMGISALVVRISTVVVGISALVVGISALVV